MGGREPSAPAPLPSRNRSRAPSHAPGRPRPRRRPEVDRRSGRRLSPPAREDVGEIGAREAGVEQRRELPLLAPKLSPHPEVVAEGVPVEPCLLVRLDLQARRKLARLLPRQPPTELQP